MIDSGWRFFATRMHGDGTETFLSDLPLSGESIINVLSGADTVQGTIAPEIAGMRIGGELALEPWATGVYAEKDGGIVAGGILQTVTPNGPKLALDAVGFSDYPSGQPYDGETYYVETDSLDIVRHIWAHLQDQPRGNIGVTLDSLKSGFLVGEELEEVEFETGLGEQVSFEAGPLKLAWWLTDDLGKIITDLAQDTPFDYRERHWWQGDNKIRHHLDLGVPTLGRRRPDLEMVVGENVIFLPSSTRDGAEYASEVWALGSGEGRAMRRGSASRFRETRLRRVAVTADKQARSHVAAANVAERELAWRTGGDDISEIVLRGWEGDQPELGDEVHVVGGGEGWGGDLDLWVRVLSKSQAPSGGPNLSLSVVRADKISA